MDDTDIAQHNQEPEKKNTKVTIQPARPRAVYNVRRPRAELIPDDIAEPDEELEVLEGLDEELTDPEETSNKVTIQPARPWPVYNVSRARAEILAIEMLTQGASYQRVRYSTGLSPKNVRRLARLVAEEAASPVSPRIVCRTPARPGSAARPRVRTTRAPAPAAPERPAAPGDCAEALQMTFSIDC
ncbi:hypothetical protein [Streptomyces sp. NPDC055912]|uniref:hypothetical protein n=1 Tax=Streptomyces sp. NPDC055912 TaxID=3345660 RepID=UPI0035DDC2EF